MHVKNVIYSSYLVPGEGEHKIMKYLRDNRDTIAKMDGSHVIDGNDSDHILLALGYNLPGLFIASDTVAFEPKTSLPIVATPAGRKPGGNAAKKTKRYVVHPEDTKDDINIDKLHTALVGMMGGEYINDFIFLCSLMGKWQMANGKDICHILPRNG